MSKQGACTRVRPTHCDQHFPYAVHRVHLRAAPAAHAATPQGAKEPPDRVYEARFKPLHVWVGAGLGHDESARARVCAESENFFRGLETPKKRRAGAVGWRAWMRLEHLGGICPSPTAAVRLPRLRSMVASNVQLEKWARIDSASLLCESKQKHFPHAPHVHQPGRGVSYASAGGPAAAAGFAASSAGEISLGFERQGHFARCV